jgi:hypothetical protein
MSNNHSLYLTLKESESVLHRFNEPAITYKEGKLSTAAKTRGLKIRTELESGYLEDFIDKCKQPNLKINLTKDQIDLINNMVDSITSEVGRALVGLTVLQMTLKSIEPEQSIRLHKGSSSSGSFSWEEGIPMRVLDKNFITPVLRKYGLIKLNADGFMMTRSLAENYPYSGLYKAAIRGARKEWIEITNLIEDQKLNATEGLKQLVSSLLSRSDAFNSLSKKTLENLRSFIPVNNSKSISDLIKRFVKESEYSARIFEVSIHSFFQAIEELKQLPGYLKPLSQMRSANKKHGNIGDIEISASKNGLSIIEAWDAKFGKTYLRDELEELSDKLESHSETELVGFITDETPNLGKEIEKRVKELEDVFNLSINILSFDDWVSFQLEKYAVDKEDLAKRWITCFTESLCQKRRSIAPIDEPTFDWVQSLNLLLSE